MKKDKKTNGNKSHPSSSETQRNRQQQAVDKAPGEQRGKGEKVTHDDLKGKKIDADPSQESGR
jgi:hypothetical protein